LVVLAREEVLEVYPSWIGSALKDIEMVARIAAVIVVGGWAYMKFVRGRVFHSRLELDVAGSAQARVDQATLAISIKVKNVGLSRVDIHQKGSGLRVLNEKKSAPKGIISAEWHHLGTFPILENHSWIEPGETVGEEMLVILPNDALNYVLLELHVASGEMVWAATRLVAIKTEAESNSTKLSAKCG
jgi:hypothetical protein